MTDGRLRCSYCDNEFPDTRTNCPHCGQPQIFPNVSKATAETEQRKLDGRFDNARNDCVAKGTQDQFKELLAATSNSHALFACPLLKLHQLVASGTDIFATYYQLEELRLRASKPAGLDWQKLRPQAETELLGSSQHIDQLHYACLSLDWESLSNYGDCVVQLSDSMIEHRASCFDGNTAVIYFLEGNFEKQLRSGWGERGKLCCAVLADRLSKDTDSTEFPKLLVVTKDETVDDQFVEVHIFGPMTARTFAEVRFNTAKHGPREGIYRDAIIEKLEAASVPHTK